MTAEAGSDDKLAGRCGTPAGMWKRSPACTIDKVLQLVAVPGVDLARQDVDGRLMIFVKMRLGASTRRQGKQMHANGLRSDRLSGYALKVAQTLLSVVSKARPKKTAGGP